VIDGKNGSNSSVDPTCVTLCRVVRSLKTKTWTRFTERIREFIPKVGCCMIWWGAA